MEYKLLAGIVYASIFILIGCIFWFFKKGSKFGGHYYLVSFLIASITMEFVADPLYKEYQLNLLSNNYLGIIKKGYPDIYVQYKKNIFSSSVPEAKLAMQMLTVQVLKRSLQTADDDSIFHYFDVYNRINKKIYLRDHNFPYLREIGHSSPGFNYLTGSTNKEYFLALRELVKNSLDNQNKNKIKVALSEDEIKKIRLKILEPLAKKYNKESIKQLFSELNTKIPSGDYDLKSNIMIDLIDSTFENKHTGAEFVRHTYSMLN